MGPFLCYRTENQLREDSIRTLSGCVLIRTDYLVPYFP